MIKLRQLFNIIKRHIKYPLMNIRHEWCDDYNPEAGIPHYHICYAARLLGSDLHKVCPHCSRKGFSPEHEDECDLCKYFGIIDMTKSGFQLHIDSRIADLEQPATWVNIVSNKANPHRGWAYYDVPVQNIVERYAKRNGFEITSNYLVRINGELVDRRNKSARIGDYADDKQEVSFEIMLEV